MNFLGFILLTSKDFFCRKSTLFLSKINTFSYPTCSRRWSIAWAEPKKTTEKRNKLSLLCDVINDVSLINRTSSESPWSEVSGLRQTKCGNHVVALWSKMNKNLKNTLERHLVDQFWWHIPQKIGILSLISNPYTLEAHLSYVRLSYFLLFLDA